MSKSCKTCEFWVQEEPPTDDPKDKMLWGECNRPTLREFPLITSYQYGCYGWKQKEDLS